MKKSTLPLCDTDPTESGREVEGERGWAHLLVALNE